MTVRRSKGPALDWDVMTREEFERAVELLVQLEFGEDGRVERGVVEPIDGRGGDGGIDIRLIRPDGRLTIFQLKHYIGGFSGQHRQRRPHVKASLERALEHEPDEWVLVVPARPSPGDYAYIGDLDKQHEPAIKVWHRARLDELLTRHPTVINLMQRDPYLLEQAAAMGLETAVLAAGVADLSNRVSALGNVVDDVDPDWTFDFARVNGQVVNTLRAKHPQAAERSPIFFQVDTCLNDTHAALRTDLNRTLGWGLAGQVTLPSDAVKSLTVQGPPLVHPGTHVGAQVTWVQPINEAIAGTPVQVELRGPDGRHLGTHHGYAVDGSPGHLGISLQAQFNDTVTLTFRMPHDCTAKANLDFSYDDTTAERTPAQVERVTQLVLDLANATAMKVSLDDHPFFDAKADTVFGWPSQDDWIGHTQALHDLAQDLEVLQRHANNHFPVPRRMSTLERISVRAARLMLDGECVMHPGWASFNITLNDPDELGTKTLLDASAGMIAVTQDPLTVTVGGHELHLPAARMWHPTVRLRNRKQVMKKLRTGRDVECVLEPTDGTTLRMFMPERLKNPDSPLVPGPWGLAGVPERLPVPGAASPTSLGIA